MRQVQNSSRPGFQCTAKGFCLYLYVPFLFIHSGAQGLKTSLSCCAAVMVGTAFKDSAAVAVAQLTSLQSLDWSDSPLTTAGLQKLTALTGLTRLAVAGCPQAVTARLSRSIQNAGGMSQLDNKLVLQCDDAVRLLSARLLRPCWVFGISTQSFMPRYKSCLMYMHAVCPQYSRGFSANFMLRGAVLFCGCCPAAAVAGSCLSLG